VLKVEVIYLAVIMDDDNIVCFYNSYSILIECACAEDMYDIIIA